MATKKLACGLHEFGWMSYRSKWAWFGLWQIVVFPTAFGQSDKPELEKPQPAVIAFHAEPARILDSNFANAINIHDSFRLDPLSGQLWKAKSVKGVVSLPDDIQKLLLYMPRRPPPFHYYFEFELKNDQHLQDVKELLAKTMVEQEEADGVTYYLLRRGSETYTVVTKDRRVVLATEGYEFDPRQFPKMTEPAARLLKETQKAPAGMSVDFDGAEKLLKSAIQFGNDNLPPRVKPYLTIPEKVVSVRGDFSLLPVPEIRVVIECRDRDDAEEVWEAVNEMIGMSKLRLNGEGPEIEMQRQFLNAIKSQSIGSQVLLTVLIPTELLAKIRQRAAEVQAMNEVRHACLAILNYDSAHKVLPFHAREGQSNELSWRVRMLPYAGRGALHGELYRSFNLSESWDSETNRPLLDLMPMSFGTGNQTGLRWVESNVQQLSDITDGYRNTIAFIHNAPPVNWTENKPVTHTEAVRMFLALKPGEALIVGMYDGRTLRIGPDMPAKTFEALLTPDGGEPIELDQ